MNASSIAMRGLSLLQVVLLMKILDPKAYGVWSGLNVLLVYGAYAGLGFEHGLAARLPYYYGRGESDRMIFGADTAYISSTVLTSLFALAVLAYAIFVPQTSSVITLGLWVMSGMIILQQQVSFFGRWFLSVHKDFYVFGWISLVSTVLSFVLILSLAYFFGISGAMIGTLIASVVTMALWKSETVFRFHWKISAELFWEMLRIGFPILLVVLCGSLIETIDRLLILKFLGTVSLGYYAVTGLGGNAIYGLLSQAGSAMSPHMGEDLGRSKDDMRSMEKFLVKPTLIFSYVATAFIMAMIFMLPPLVQLLLTKYIPGLPAFYLFVPGPFFLCIILTANNILNLVLITRARQSLIVYIQIVAILVEVGFSLLFISWGWNIAGVALASTISYAVYGSAILYLAARYVINDRVRERHFLFDAVAPFVIAMAFSVVIFWTGNRWGGNHLILKALGQLMVCALVWVQMGWSLNKKTGIADDLQPLIRDVFRNLQQRIVKHFVSFRSFLEFV